MSMTDPIADMLTRIRNAAHVRLKTVDMPHSRLKTQVLDALKREGFIGDYQVAGEGTRKAIRVYLKYSRVGDSVIQEIRRESSPGRRVYRPATKLTPVLRGIGCAVNYRSVHTLTYYRERFGHARDAFPIAAQFGERTVTLPLWPDLPPDDVSVVVDALGAALEEARAGARTR